MTTKDWTIQVRLDEQGDDTFADAILSIENKTEIRGSGHSRRNPSDARIARTSSATSRR